MITKWLKRISIVMLVFVVLFAAYYMIKPRPVLVDMVVIARGDIETTIDEEGETRVKDIYRVSAPVAGKLERLDVRIGTRMAKGQRFARIRPVDPPIRDIRTRRELSAATKAAQAYVDLAQAEIDKARSALKFSKAELERALALTRSQTISARTLQQAELDVAVKTAQLAEAVASLEFRRREMESARARELQPIHISRTQVEDQCCVAVVAPVSGTILRLLSESERVVQAGTPLVEIGNLKNLEIVVDLLSADAVAITSGSLARIEGWGGAAPLNARVRRIDPAGFTKVSALGIEEQRVNVILDFTDPPQRWLKLGHSYRIIVRLITSYKKNVLSVPISALFRTANQWSVYAEDKGVAKLRPIELGTFSLTFAEVLSGLEEGVKVIVYPSDKIENNVPVVERQEGKLPGGK